MKFSNDTPVNVRYVNLDNEYKQAIITTSEMYNGPIPRIKETIVITEEIKDKLTSIIPMEKTTAKDDYEGAIIRGDIIVAGTIPSPDIEMVLDFPNMKDVSGRVMILPKEDILEMIKTTSPSEQKSIPVGFLEINIRHLVKVTVMIKMLDNLIFDWLPIIKVPQKIRNMSNEELLRGSLEEICKIRDIFFLCWYGIQIALLNPVIAERFHRETVPYDDNKKHTNKKKSPKRYVKKITIDDISDLTFAKEKGHHQIKEPFWWVSGHWRNQATKDGHKKIFIQGYWKGILREVAESKDEEPREREIVFEENDGKPYFID